MSYEESARQVGAAADHELTIVRADLMLAESARAVLAEQLTESQAQTRSALDAAEAAEAEVTRLKARVAELEALLPKPATLFGVTVNGAVRRTHTDLHPKVAVSRVYAQGVTSWAAEGQHKQFSDGRWACSNSYSLSEANLPKLLATIPDADKSKIVGWADGHELENPDKNLTPAAVKDRMRRTAPIIRDAGLLAVSCVMGFSIKDDEWLKWIDPDAVDILAFDKYNSGNKKNPPIYQDPVKVVAEAAAQSARFGKPFAFWETGTNNFGDPAARVAWTEALHDELVKQNAVHAIWFDRESTSGSGWDASMDRATAEAWLG